MLSVMRQELQAIKGALGPYWSPDSSSDSPPTLSSRDAAAPADVMAHAATTPNDDVPPPADIAAYFPPSSSDAPPSPTMSTTSSNRSLSATLSALRSEMQTYDARARMSASAHAAEIGAIRQVVAGLRMQLHAVLMELSNASAGADGWAPHAAARFFIPGLLVPPPSSSSLPPPPSVVSITKL